MGAAELSRRMYELLNARDFEGALLLVDDACEIVNVGWGVAYTGKAGFRAFMRGWKTLDPNCRVDVLTQLEGADGVTNECFFHATHVGPLDLPSGPVPPTGSTMSLPFCEVWRFKDGKLISLYN